MKTFNENLIAPCGMNCALCSGHLRDKDKCPGCKYSPTLKYCQCCVMRNCTDRKGQYCFDCAKFPCQRLKHLDKRYRSKYKMSEIDNLELIRDRGMEQFLEIEREKWLSDKGILCVHNGKYYPQ